MNPDIKARWIEALRSGDYEQALGSLRPRNGGFCCLGVLCDLYSEETDTPWTEYAGWFFMLGYDSYLPDEVAKWAGCEDYPRINILGESRGLVSMNDSGTPFDKIADLIEEHL